MSPHPSLRESLLRWLRHGLCLLMCLAAVGAQAAMRDDIRLAMQLEPPLLDPTATPSASAGEITYANVFEGLTVIDGQGQIRPRLSTAWTVSPDGLTYEFALREGVRFHDGKPFNAQVAAFSLGRILQADSKNPQKPWYERIQSVEATAPLRLVVRLSQPDALLLFALAQPAAVMVHPDTVASNGNRPNGTGPFRVVRWNKGESVAMERNEQYWGKAPTLRGARFLFAHTTAEMENMVSEGMVDGLLSVTRMSRHFVLRPDYRTSTRNLEGKIILAINNARPPFNDVRVRRALAQAIDRDRVAMELFGPQVPVRRIGSHFSPSQPAYVDLVARYPYDRAQARALLAKAGVKPKTPITITVPPTDYGRAGALVIASELEAIGFRVELNELDWSHWLSDVFDKKQYDVTLIMHVEPLDIGIYARDNYYFNYDNAAFKAVWRQVQNARSEAELNRLLGEAQRQVTDDAVNVFLFMRPDNNLMHRDLAGMWEKCSAPSFVLEDIHWVR